MVVLMIVENPAHIYFCLRQTSFYGMNGNNDILIARSNELDQFDVK